MISTVVASQAVPMLGLEPGDAVLVQPQTRYDADAAYLTHDGRIIRLAWAFKGDRLRISEAPGQWQEVPRHNAERLIAGRIKRVIGHVPAPGEEVCHA